MLLKERLQVLVQLGEQLQQPTEALEGAMQLSHLENRWFTIDHIKVAMNAIVEQMLQPEQLKQWLDKYDVPTTQSEPQIIALILAGNLPLVGFHDFLCTFVSGHHAQIKLSHKDKRLLPYLVQLMAGIDERVKERITFVDKLKGFDAVIATGSNNSARYFEHYFGKYPHIIRKSRTSIAILSGEETPEDIHELGKDIFEHFGLGCRNVSKLFVPTDYDLTFLLDHLESYRSVVLHSKYRNNYDYNRSLLLINNVPHLASHHIMLQENKSITSPISLLYYEYYDNEDDLANKIIEQQEKIQCVVGSPQKNNTYISFGKAQRPELWDYADKVDTLAFLLDL